jgi:hypothetical protein
VQTKNRHVRHKHPLTTRACRVRCRHVKGGSFTTGSIYLEVPNLVEEWLFNVNLFSYHIDTLIIFEKLILINECNFRFINIEATKTITSVMKLLMEISLFQWSQVSKHSEQKPMINAWFRRCNISINLNIFLLC